MRAIRLHNQGGPEQLQVENIELPAIKTGELSLRVDLAGVNFIDVYHRRGQYQIPMPSGLGIEGIGTGDDGQRFFWLSAMGSYAEAINIPIHQLTPIPQKKISDEELLPLLCQGMTAQYLTDSAYNVRAGEVALVTAAAGGVGLILIQLLKALGAKVIALTSSKERSMIALEHGADVVGLYGEMEQLTSEFTEERGVDVVYDSVGKDTFDRALLTLAHGGMFVLYGGASGPVPAFDLMRLNSRSLAIRRPTLATYTASSDERLRRLNTLLSLREKGLLKYPTAKIFPLSEVGKAHQLLESRTFSGKIGLAPWKI